MATWHRRLAGALLVLATLAVYARVAGHEFVGYDDPGYVTANPVVQRGLSLDGVAWAFTTTAMSNWHPVTWLSHLLDVQCFGLAPAGHHLVSVALHALSAALLFLLLARLTDRPWRSLTVAALFALHPLHVESVAWVAERKDVLSGVLWHLTLLLYVEWTRRPGPGRYLAALACFAAGLMAKPMLVTLPVVLLLLDAWPLARWKASAGPGPLRPASSLPALVREKLPFLALSLASSAVTIYAQHQGGSMAGLREAPLGLRAENAVVAAASYLGLAIWPRDLAVLYPLPPSIPAWRVAVSAGVLLAITAGVTLRARRAPYLAVGWSWFLVTLLPVIGLVQVGAQSMADRYTYLPLTGIFLMAVWGGAELVGARPWRGPLLATAAVAAAAAVTWGQLGHWRDSLTLFRHTLEVTSGNYLILNNYGAALNDRGRPEEAIPALQRALAIEPGHAEAWYNLGRIHQVARQDLEAAALYYRRAIQLKPGYLDAQINLGGVLNRLGRFREGLEVLEPARARAPERAELCFNLGVSYAALGERERALREAEALGRLDPGLAQALRGFINRE